MCCEHLQKLIYCSCCVLCASGKQSTRVDCCFVVCVCLITSTVICQTHSLRNFKISAQIINTIGALSNFVSITVPSSKSPRNETRKLIIPYHHLCCTLICTNLYLSDAYLTLSLVTDIPGARTNIEPHRHSPKQDRTPLSMPA